MPKQNKQNTPPTKNPPHFSLLIFSLTDVSNNSCAADGIILQVAEYEVCAKVYFFSLLSKVLLFIFLSSVVVSYLMVTFALPLHSLW